MIPLGDEGTPVQRGLPIVNLTIIAVNIGVFLLQLSTGLDNGPITMGWSLVPREISTGTDIIGPVADFPGLTLAAAPLGIPWLTFLTSMFMHGGWLHIGSNMLFLFIFGDNIEDNMGSVKYLIFYLMCGFAADLAQFFLGGTDSAIPNLGASGAIAGVLGAYLILFPQAKVRALIPLGLFTTITRVPAILMLGFWIVTQFLSVFVVEEQAAGGGGGVAYWAHIGGFIAGAVLVFVFRRRGSEQRATVFGT
ncbi:MAG TPA: rhomboid family intramembrane serine protease [Chloroflexia bacterium]|nr:rhomboid family intramembrane serine protease [Chloroflexia bacterium]